MILVLTTMGWLITIFVVGWGGINLLFIKGNCLKKYEQLALSFPVGLGVVTLLMVGLSLLKIPYSIPSIVLPGMAIAITGFLLGKADPIKKEQHQSFGKLEKFFIGCMGFQVAFTFFQALIKPIDSFDGINNYANKAKMFFLEGGIPADYVNRFRDVFNHIEYPLLLPLSETSLYVFRGTVDDLTVKLIAPLIYLSIVVVFFAVVRRYVSRPTAVFFTFILATIPTLAVHHAIIMYADLPLSFYYSFSVFYLILWMKEKCSGYLFLSILLSVLSLWTKVNALMLVGVNILLMIIYLVSVKDRPWKIASVYVVILASAIGGYMLVIRAQGLNFHPDIEEVSTAGVGGMSQQFWKGLERVPVILYEYQKKIFGLNKWNIFWIALILLSVTNFRLLFTGLRKYVFFALFFSLGGYTLIYLTTNASLEWFIDGTASRFLLHLIPISVLLGAMLFEDRYVGPT